MTNPAVALPLIGKAMFMDGRTLDKVIAPEFYKQVVERGEKAGIPAAAMQRMKPWMAAVSLTAPRSRRPDSTPSQWRRQVLLR